MLFLATGTGRWWGATTVASNWSFCNAFWAVALLCWRTWFTSCHSFDRVRWMFSLKRIKTSQSILRQNFIPSPVLTSGDVVIVDNPANIQWCVLKNGKGTSLVTYAAWGEMCDEHEHEENMQTPHRKVLPQQGMEPKTLMLWGTVLTTKSPWQCVIHTKNDLKLIMWCISAA